MHILSYLKKHRISQTAFADKLGISQALVWQWMKWQQNPKKGTKITAERAKEIEKVTGGEVSRFELRPDIWERAT